MFPARAFLTTAFASAGAPDAANDEPQFDYRTAVKRGVIEIEGRRVDDDRAFTLRVGANGEVTGNVAGASVRFSASAAAHRRLVALVANAEKAPAAA
jgi:hypothetical protein